MTSVVTGRLAAGSMECNFTACHSEWGTTRVGVSWLDTDTEALLRFRRVSSEMSIQFHISPRIVQAYGPNEVYQSCLEATSETTLSSSLHFLLPICISRPLGSTA